MQQVDEVVSAEWVLTIEEDRVLEDHSVVVDKGIIVDILPTGEVSAKYQPKSQTVLPDTALMPGFINSHTHTPMTYLRGVSDDIPLREWLQETIWPLEGKLADAEFVRDGAELAILEMIMGGVTTFNDMYFFPEAVCDVVVKTGIRAAIGTILIEFPTPYGSGPDDYLEKGQKMREKFNGEPLLSWTVCLHAPYTCTDTTISKGGALSEQLNIPLHIHLHETEAECQASLSGDKASPSCHLSENKCTPLANLKRLGLVNSRLLGVHMVCLNDEEISWCAEAGVSVLHCPSSNLKLASGFCRVADLVEAGVNVCLGTDGASSNNTLDMLAEMKLAAILAKGYSRNAKAVPAALALRMATLNGAKALGIADKTGSLVVGKEADMIAISFSPPGTWPQPCVATSPGFDPVTHIVYSSSRDQVTDVWVRGRRLMKGRNVQTLTASSVYAKSEKWSNKVMETLTGKPPVARTRRSAVPSSGSGCFGFMG